MLATVVNEIVTLGFFFWGDGSGTGFLLFFPFLIIKLMFFGMLFGMFTAGYRRPPRRERPRRRRRAPQPDPAREAERRQYEEDLRNAEAEVDSWTTYDI